MAETKNVFLGAKMNKDLDPRLISNREYIEARNASVTDSAGGDSGVLENVFGNIELTDFGLTDSKLKIIGLYVDNSNDRLFAFITNYTDSSASGLSNPAPSASAHYIAVYNTVSNDYTILVGGSFLNFSDTHEILGIDLIENLLFFTDNRNQPRKINVNLALSNPYGSANPYYTSEDHISVAKYYPCFAPDLSALNGDGTLFVGSVLQLQTSPRILGLSSVPSPVTFTVGNGSLDATTNGNGGALTFTVTFYKEYDTQLPISVPIRIEAAITTNNGIGGYEPGDTITISAQDLDTIFGPNASTLGDAVFVVTRSNMARTQSMWDVVSQNLPDGVTPNPYYDANFTGDEKFLSDKFVRFSYRFKFEDNEYSLIAPFSQAAFIPKQDGYFTEDSIPTSMLDSASDSDEVSTIKSTVVDFFENKVNKVDISIPMPEDVVLGDVVNNIYDKYKVTEIDILYKESDGVTIKVVDTITFEELKTASGAEYVYTYDSSKPIRSLPTKETIRVSDKVPLRAKAQAVAGNRVIYGNLTLKSASLGSLDYNVTTGSKLTYGSFGSTSQREYPNHTVKQNRTYQVGVVLSDKFGRQSDVILSPNSTVFHPYKSSLMDLDYLGDSLQVQFNAPIPNVSSNIGYIGLYNEEENPLGWYSYKFVVKQQEQSYYNVYLPTILNGYPQSITGNVAYALVNDEAYITLFSDNINKVPRDLQEVGPQDVQFSSSARLYGRVYNTSYLSTSATNRQYFPENIADEVTLIGDRNEIGLDRTAAGKGYYSSPFYSIPTDNIGDTIGDGSSLVGANPYIGRVSTLKLIGAPGGGDLTSTPAPGVTDLKTRLNVYETAPFVSNLDIFWETSTSGLISELNKNVAQNFSKTPVQLRDFVWSLSEDDTPGTEICRFNIAASNNIVLSNPNTQAELIEVRDGNGGIVTDKFNIYKDFDNSFYITTSAGAYFTYNQHSIIRDNYTFTIKASNGNISVSLISTGYGNYLSNVSPSATASTINPIQEIRQPSAWSELSVLDGVNGSAETSAQKTGLVWEVVKAEFQWTNNSNQWTEYETPVGDMFRIVKGSGQSIPETLQYNNQFVCLNVLGTNLSSLYNYQNRTTTNVRVTLRLIDSGGTGLQYQTIQSTTINRTD